MFDSDNSELVSREKINESRERGKLIRERELNDIRTTLKSRSGRRLYWRLLCAAGVFRQSYMGNPEDTFFNEGRRSLGLKMLSDLMEAAPDQYAVMAKEFKEHMDEYGNDTSNGNNVNAASGGNNRNGDNSAGRK